MAVFAFGVKISSSDVNVKIDQKKIGLNHHTKLLHMDDNHDILKYFMYARRVDACVSHTFIQKSEFLHISLI